MRVWFLLLATVSGCGAGRLELRGAPDKPFDVVIVPGCPSESDGALSRCQMARALWAAHLWDLKWASYFITSGAAVHTPYVEAEALAAAMTAAGVPAERIYLEPHALHTDENMFYSLQIARALGFRTIAVAGEAAAWDCLMLLDWGQACRGISPDHDWVRGRHAQLQGALDKIRAARRDDFVPLRQREREIARRTGRHRPPSYLLYLELGAMRTNGERWVPPGMPASPPRTTWAQRRTDF